MGSRELTMDGACVCRSSSPSSRCWGGCSVVCSRERLLGCGRPGWASAGGDGGSAGALWPEGTPLCSAVAHQLDLGLGTVKPLLSQAASLDKHGGLLLKPLPARQPCRCEVPLCRPASPHFILPGAPLMDGHGLGEKEPARGPCRARDSVPRALSTLASFYGDSFSLLFFCLSSGQCQAS